LSNQEDSMGKNFLGDWVMEKDNKRRLALGRAGALVQHNLRGTSGEIFAVSVLHLSLQQPVLKPFEKVKVQMRSLRPFSGTSSCDIAELDRKFKQFLGKFGVKRNVRGKGMRCTRKFTVPRGYRKRNARGRPVRCSGKTGAQDTSASQEQLRGRKRSMCQVNLRGARIDADAAGARSPKLVTPTKKARKSAGSVFSESKLPPNQVRLTRYNSKTLKVVFESPQDVLKDDATYLAAMSAQHFDPLEWKPCGKPMIADADGNIYEGKPKCLGAIAFPLTVALKLTHPS
jgi:hypothetical protein